MARGRTFGVTSCIREQIEASEAQFLCERATLSAHTRGRLIPEPPCPIRTEFQRDRDRIIHSKAFRRLKHKTQVFIAPEGDHYRTRLTHTLEVAQIARTVARALRLNEDLTEAIALGHDLGHTPFGHAGEEVLNRIVPGGFRHYEQSLRVVDKLEQGRGLNLTWEVRDGILNHTGDLRPQTLEGQIVHIADRVAYINHDIDDSLRAGIITQDDLPSSALAVLGQTTRERINSMVMDLIEVGLSQGIIGMSPKIQEATNALRQFLFQKVYVGSRAKAEEGKVKRVIEQLYYYYLEHPDEIPGPNLEAADLEESRERKVADYIAGMTDQFAINCYVRLFIPRGFPV